MCHSMVEDNGSGGLNFGQARNTMEAYWLRLYTTQWGCLVAILTREGCWELEATVEVEVKNGLECKLWWLEVAVLAFG